MGSLIDATTWLWLTAHDGFGSGLSWRNVEPINDSAGPNDALQHLRYGTAIFSAPTQQNNVPEIGTKGRWVNSDEGCRHGCHPC